MSNRKMFNSIWQLMPKSWVKSVNKRSNETKFSNQNLNSNLPLHDQIKNQAIYSILSTVEPHFEIIHDLIIWKYPDQTIAAFLIINIFYWFIVFLSSHLITAVAFIVFIYKVQEFWSTVVWPEIALEPPQTPPSEENWTCVDPNLLSAPEITRFVDSCLNWIKNRLIAHWNLRSTDHLAFFLINLLVFTGLGYLGTIFSGAVIIHFILMAALLAPGINMHLFPFIKSNKETDLKEEEENSNKLNNDKNEEVNKEEVNKDKTDLNEKNCDKEMDKAESSKKELTKLTDNDQMMDKERDDNLNDDGLDKASKLFGQFFENTKSYLNQMFDNETPTEEFIKQKEVQLNKAHNFLTDVVLNQDPNFKVDNNELNDSFKYLENEFKKLDELRDSVKLSQKPNNSIESNLVPSYFGNDSSSVSSEDDDFEIIQNPSYQ